MQVGEDALHEGLKAFVKQVHQGPAQLGAVLQEQEAQDGNQQDAEQAPQTGQNLPACAAESGKNAFAQLRHAVAHELVERLALRFQPYGQWKVAQRVRL